MNRDWPSPMIFGRFFCKGGGYPSIPSKNISKKTTFSPLSLFIPIWSILSPIWSILTLFNAKTPLFGPCRWKWRSFRKEGDTPPFNKKLSAKQFFATAFYRDKVALLALILFLWTSGPCQTRVKVQQMLRLSDNFSDVTFVSEDNQVVRGGLAAVAIALTHRSRHTHCPWYPCTVGGVNFPSVWNLHLRTSV